MQGSGTTPWTGGVYQDSLTCWAGGNPGYCGPNAIVRPGNNINFSWGSTYLYQQQNVSNLVPSNAVNVTGYQFGFTAKNGNGWDDGRVDQLTALVRFWDASGGRGATNLLYGNSWNLNYKFNWTTFNYDETLPTPLNVKSIGQVQYGFIGKDNNGWAGPYGPEINNVSFRLKYSVDPCATNPAYSPNCANFNTVATSGNLVPNPNGYATFGNGIDQSYAINTALAAAGSAAQIHGFQWGYVANANGPYCAFDFIVCWDQRNPSVTTNVNITNSSGASLYSVSRTYQNSYNTTNYSYLFPSSQTMSNLGNFNFTAYTNDQAYVGSMWSRALYTADPCVVNPLSSPSCPGYAVAYAKLMVSNSTSTTSSTTTAYTGTTSVTTTSQVETTPTGVIDQTSPQTTTASSSTSTSSSSSSTSTTIQDTAQTTTAVATADPAQPASTTPTPAGGPAQTTATVSSSSSSTSSSSGGSAGPSKLAMSVLKSVQEKDKATQAAAVQSAAKTLENATQNSQASSNAAIAMNQDMSANTATAAAAFASQTTQASQQTAVQSTQSQQTTQQFSSQQQQSTRMIQQVQQQQQDNQQVQSQTSTSVVKLQSPQPQDAQQSQAQTSFGAVQLPQNTYTPPQQQIQDTQPTQVATLKPPTQPVVEVQQQSSLGTGITVGRSMFSFNTLSLSSNPSMSIATQPSPQIYQPRLDTRQFEVEAPQMPVASFSGSRAGNPLSEIIMQQRFELMQNNITQPASSVNKNVQPNELAGGVDIASMASVPVGFNAYSFVLKDAAFYEPKEVYKNQRTVDNERVLRGLTRGSDSLHQQMVDQQYKAGN